LRSSLVGGRRHLVLQAHAATPAPWLNSSKAQSPSTGTTPSGGVGLLHRHALERVRHVVDPHRQRQAAAGLAVAQLARVS
jgi:hypothetical protein